MHYLGPAVNDLEKCLKNCARLKCKSYSILVFFIYFFSSLSNLKHERQAHGNLYQINICKFYSNFQLSISYRHIILRNGSQTVI